MAAKNAILSIFAVSIALPFFGRTAISWIVDVTTVGATIAYTLASASAFKLARQNKDTRNMVIGLAGMVISLLFCTGIPDTEPSLDNNALNGIL